MMTKPVATAPITVLDDEFKPLEDWEFLTETLLKFVSRPEQVQVTEERVDARASVLLIHVAPEDRGKVIGRNGEMMSILRKLFGRIAAAHGRKVYVRLVDEPLARTAAVA